MKHGIVVCLFSMFVLLEEIVGDKFRSEIYVCDNSSVLILIGCNMFLKSGLLASESAKCHL